MIMRVCIFLLGIVAIYGAVEKVSIAAPQDSHFSLVLSQKNVSQKTELDLQNFLHEVISLIPDKIKKTLNRKIVIEFDQFGTNSALQVPACLSPDVILSNKSESHPTENSNSDIYGEVVSNEKIKLNLHLIPEILKGQLGAKTYPCGHKNFYRLAIATLLHEICHLYDFSSLNWTSRKTVVSGQKNYQKLAGWRKQFTLTQGFIRHLLPKNQLFIRSPDPYEYHSILEHFAVNMEYFLMDPEYECRRPAFHSFLSNHFDNFHPFPINNCKVNTQIYAHSYGTGLNRNIPVDLDPSRVYEIHYFQAAPGKGIESQWGHSMFRVVVCAPDRAEVGPDCLKDLKHHIIVSYSAYIDEAQIKIWNGLTGKYSTQIFMFLLKDVVENYTKLELRDIYSYPLKLSPGEKNLFLFKILQDYWEYQGRYYFLSNNCNTESVQLLKGVLDDSQSKSFSACTPTQLEKKLETLGLLDAGVLSDSKLAIEKGYLFPSSQATLLESFQILKEEFQEKKYGPIFHWEKLKQYLYNSTAQERRELLNQFSHVSDQESRLNSAKLFASLYYLESMIEIKRAQLLRGLAFKSLEEMAQNLKKNNIANRPEQELYELTQKSLRQAIPLLQLKSGYGVPLHTDFIENPEVSKNTSELDQWIEENFRSQIEEQNQIRENKKIIFKRIISKK